MLEIKVYEHENATMTDEDKKKAKENAGTVNSNLAMAYIKTEDYRLAIEKADNAIARIPTKPLRLKHEH